MDQYKNNGNNETSKQPAQPQKPSNQQPSNQKPTSVKGALAHLDVIGPIVMIVALFLGAFYKDAGGRFAMHYVYPGYKLIFNSNYMLGTLLIVCPAVALLSGYIKSLKGSEKLIKLVMPVITLIFVFVLKGQIGDEIASDGAGTVSLAIGGLIYMLGNLVSLVVSGAAFFNIDLNKKVKEFTKK